MAFIYGGTEDGGLYIHLENHSIQIEENAYGDEVELIIGGNRVYYDNLEDAIVNGELFNSDPTARIRGSKTEIDTILCEYGSRIKADPLCYLVEEMNGNTWTVRFIDALNEIEYEIDTFNLLPRGDGFLNWIEVEDTSIRFYKMPNGEYRRVALDKVCSEWIMYAKSQEEIIRNLEEHEAKVKAQIHALCDTAFNY